jgi:hypothetical protein
MLAFRPKKLKKEKIALQKESENSRRSSVFSTTSQNTFLIEIENNCDIDENIRSEINSRFKKSIINATYKFPRISYNPFPTISLQQKFIEKELGKKLFKKARGPIRLISHTPKPSLTKTIRITKRNMKRASPSPEIDSRLLSITPTPVTIITKSKKTNDFPKLKNSGVRSPVPFISKPFQLAYK